MQEPFGFRFLKSVLALDFNSSVIEAVVPASDTTPLYINDPVISLQQTDDTGLAFVKKALPDDSIRGVVVDFRAERQYEEILYRPASVRRIVRICQDPFLYIRAKVNSNILTTDIDRYINIDSGGGNPITGTSSVSLDYATISDTDGQFKILSIIENVDLPSGKYAIVDGMISKHELLRGITLSHGFWDRIGTHLIPDNPGDSIDLLQLGNGKGFLDPNNDYDVVNLRTYLRGRMVDSPTAIYSLNVNENKSVCVTTSYTTGQVKYVLPELTSSNVGMSFKFVPTFSQVRATITGGNSLRFQDSIGTEFIWTYLDSDPTPQKYSSLTVDGVSLSSGFAWIVTSMTGTWSGT